MTHVARDLIDKAFRALQERDRDGILACFAPDAVLFDPHYPQPLMKGTAEIAEGIDWGLKGVKRFGFTIVNYFASEDGTACCVECDTNHTLAVGGDLHFPQVFIVETKAGLISRLQAYEPYGPNGIGGAFLGFERLKRRLAGKRTHTGFAQVGK